MMTKINNELVTEDLDYQYFLNDHGRHCYCYKCGEVFPFKPMVKHVNDQCPNCGEVFWKRVKKQRIKK